MSIRFFTAGESHGPALVAILEGMPAGLPISTKFIDHELLRRQYGFGAGPRMKIESDSVQVLSGILDGVTIGSPIAMIINNKDHAKWKNTSIEPFTVPRPGHADLTGAIKYGYRDLRPALERASARETAARVSVGAICKQFLQHFNIIVGGYVSSIGDVDADMEKTSLVERLMLAEKNELRCPDPLGAANMRERVNETIRGKNTLGGVIEIVVIGIPPGLGSHVQWDRRLESKLGAAVLSVQAIKGVEFGTAFENTRLAGTDVHDSIRVKGDRLTRSTNRAGGIEGGISNGEPIIIRAAMKPIATTLTPQESVDLATGQNVPTNYERSDFCPVPRAVPILEAMAAFVTTDMLIEKLGGDSMQEMIPRYNRLRSTKFSDLPMDNTSHRYWSDIGANNNEQ